ncbi:hypothetical protein TVAG_477700 [Trichomonas vaginalis G3]|uniref:Uncharacterized protein n=1 Tax=Trichomonas vaginalis (strain ATCC PRA-98 / G3) TaxID=412133 RepID=A2G244_TRIV3|nr:hypothetical protein TVAGG3_0374940 [Trichomonas vaginalis G3]EAX88767.1 hypothetical protein TVAG_477700 [Trichomonas vaginalis G3]KAI5532873.1 hypothetical protein TVAGG3_0374940 [Trichomonas vaginalis G3]|eukprot:XP_001301697.1 hypothetical protein [Trichomonas vaginalis G3]
MPPRQSKIPKRSEKLENDVNEMEKVMKMLRSQIDEERAKVNQGPHWVAGAEGPITKFDPHSQFARNIIRKKKPAAKDATKKDSQRNSARSAQKEEPPQELKPSQPEEPVQPEKISPKKRKVEIVVEKQAGALWGYNHEMGISPMDNDEEEDMPRSGGGALWGPPPDERENAKAFQEELQRQRAGRNAEQPKQTENQIQNQDEEETNPPPKKGGALWGPPPDEEAEAEKFRRAVEKFRGGSDQKVDENGLPIPVAVEKSSSGAEPMAPTNLRPQPKPTGFTYFDMLVNKDILDDVRYIDKQ